MGWQNSPAKGVLFIDKPVDFTSFDVCAVLRGMLHTRKIGHSGTLDPMATGVLPILVGSATRALDFIPSHDKTYVADFKLGMRSDTLDITGNILSQSEADISQASLLQAISEFKGTIEQIPPMYSAVSVNGQKLYDLARKGIEVERKPRQVVIYDIRLDDYRRESASGRLTVSCSKGTYIRTLIDDIGVRLGCGALLTGLRRTMASGIDIGSCITLEQAQQYKDEGTLEEKLHPVDSLFNAYPAVFVSEKQAIRFENGAGLALDRISCGVSGEDGAICKVYTRDKRFLGLGIKADDELKVLKRF